MTDQSGDLVCFCLFLCLIVFVVLAYKRLEGMSCRFLIPLFLSSHYYHHNQTMSSPTAFPFSFKEDACAQDVVECMEQVGGLF